MTERDGIVTRLRRDHKVWIDKNYDVLPIQIEAATEIEHLRAQVARLREALNSIASAFTSSHLDAMARWEGSGTECFADDEWQEANVIEPLSKIARAALKETER